MILPFHALRTVEPCRVHNVTASERTCVPYRAVVIAEGSLASRTFSVAEPRARVLVVEDAEDVQGLVIDALAAAGYHVTGAADGESALSLILESEFDAV